MTPNFALNLSEDGIVLLHRHPSGAGWVEIGAAPIDSDDLGAALAALRDKAEALEGSDFRTKLILPPSQLLYATIMVEGDTKASVEHALEDRTPYTAAQLNYDISGEPPEVKVVAVARETLEEAESFLGPYGFNPVGFTALPDPSHFSGSPDLGPLPSVGGPGNSANDDPIRVMSSDEVAALDFPDLGPEAEIIEVEAASELDELPEEIDQDDGSEIVEVLADAPTPVLKLPTAPAAAFSSRRKPVLGPATNETGDIVISRAPRIAIPTDELRKAPVSKKPPKVEPRIKRVRPQRIKRLLPLFRLPQLRQWIPNRNNLQ